MPEKRELHVFDRVQGEYTRTISSQPVAFTCQRCVQVSRREQFPGPTPKYCLLCLPIIEAERNAARVRAHRDRKRAERQQQPPSA
jgi:hypothetical protein